MRAKGKGPCVSDERASRIHGGEGWLVDAGARDPHRRDRIGIIAGAVSSILGGGPTTTQYQGLSTLFQAAYFWSAAGKGQTLGSRALNIRVVKTDGSYLDYVGAFLRYIGFFVSCLVFLIGVIWAAFDA